MGCCGHRIACPQQVERLQNVGGRQRCKEQRKGPPRFKHGPSEFSESSELVASKITVERPRLLRCIRTRIFTRCDAHCELGNAGRWGARRASGASGAGRTTRGPETAAPPCLLSVRGLARTLALERWRQREPFASPLSRRSYLNHDLAQGVSARNLGLL